MEVFRFGRFELIPDREELRASGTRIRLSHQPFRVLLLLVTRAGSVVTREEVRRELWGDDTFVDFEQGINAAIRNVRAALNDAAEAPRYLETIPRKGYRFIAAVERVAAETPPVPPVVATLPRPRRRMAYAALALFIAVATACALAALRFGRDEAKPRVSGRVAILPFRSIGGGVPGVDPSVFAEEIGMHMGILRPRVVRVADVKDADTIVVGTVQRSSGSLRINVRGLDGRSRAEVWTQTHERSLKELGGLSIEVAHHVVRALAEQYVPPPRSEPLVRSKVSAAALDLYRQARRARSLPLPQRNYDRAIELFHAAIRAEPRFAEAWSGLGDIWIECATHSGGAKQTTTLADARQALERALAIDPNCTEALSDHGLLLMQFDHDFLAAEESFRRAVAIDHDYVDAHANLAAVLSAMGQHDEAIAECLRTQQLNPLMLSPSAPMALMDLFARRYDEAVAEYREIESLHGRPGDGQWGTLTALIAQGQLDGAAAQVAKMLPDQNITVALPRTPSARQRAFTKALAKLEPMMLGLPADMVNRDYVLAIFYAQLGDRERAFTSLDRAIERHASMAMFLAVDPRLDALRGDPRFEERMRRMNLLP